MKTVQLHILKQGYINNSHSYAVQTAIDPYLCEYKRSRNNVSNPRT